MSTCHAISQAVAIVFSVSLVLAFATGAVLMSTGKRK